MANLPVFSRFLGSVLPGLSEGSFNQQLWLQILSSGVVLTGIYVAYLLFYLRFDETRRYLKIQAVDRIDRFLYAGWGFDWLYDRVFIRPVEWMSRIDPNDFVDLIFKGIAGINVLIHRFLSRTQTGRLNWYVTGTALGAVILLALVVLL